MTLHLAIYPPMIDLAPCAEAQVAYVLVTIGAEGSVGAMPLNWVVVADASRSMRIPIVSEEQFRDLVRGGGAHEVLVDGLPVWQLAGPVPEAIRAVAPSALDHTARALHSVVERLEQDDRLCLVACAERAQRLASGNGARRDDLVAGIAALRAAQLGEETDLAAGMRLALEELGATGRVGRIVLLTDGFTRDPEACIALARVAAARGASISTLGLGGEFQDDLLTRLADLTGGRATFLRRAEEIPAAVSAEFDAARGAVARSLTLEIRLTRSVTLRHATRLAPDLAPLEWESDPDAWSIRLRLGDLERGAAVRLLLEFLAPPAPAVGARMRLAALTARAGTAQAGADVLGHYAGPGAPDTIILAGAGRASIARLQRRAAAAAASGDAAGAARLLQTVAARLRDLGERELALAALREAETLATTGRDTGLGARELTYATRRLG
ncbi:MAG: VWA domain-containing protein [Oscillochloridaceae bacterium]|nr:VWA domain-containing protein [Chloroflexaceae bacterium]MDW8392295.1 VWA domain-containing protein [Oscillochloridaceae bacterium]